MSRARGSWGVLQLGNSSSYSSYSSLSFSLLSYRGLRSLFVSLRNRGSVTAGSGRYEDGSQCHVSFL